MITDNEIYRRIHFAVMAIESGARKLGITGKEMQDTTKLGGRGMSKLYHGSYIEVATPFVGLGRKKVDFGQGFYLTKLQSQAQSWAAAIAERKGSLLCH